MSILITDRALSSKKIKRLDSYRLIVDISTFDMGCIIIRFDKITRNHTNMFMCVEFDTRKGDIDMVESLIGVHHTEWYRKNLGKAR